MVKVETYQLPPTGQMPNSPYPLLHYRGVLLHSTGQAYSAAQAHDVLLSNGWRAQWIFRYGPSQRAHYHSRTHECMAVLSGRARVRFGVADVASLHGDAHEVGGVELDAQPGDVFVLPAGMAHKTFDARPQAEFKLLTPGHGHGIEADNVREVLETLELTGFTMLGAYPVGALWDWDFKTGGEHTGSYQSVWDVPRPHKDPVVGMDQGGLCGLWK